MDNQEFLKQIQGKIEGLAGREIEVVVDYEQKVGISVNFSSLTPTVTVGHGVLEFPGLARMAIEYAVACIRTGRNISPLEFASLLQRN